MVPGRLLGEREHHVRCRGRGTVLCHEWALPGGVGCAILEPLAGEGGRDTGALPALRPRQAGGRAGAKPPSPGPRAVTCGRKQGGGVAQDPSWRVTWKCSPSLPLHPSPSPDSGCSGFCFQRGPPVEGACLTAKTRWKKLN